VHFVVIFAGVYYVYIYYPEGIFNVKGIAAAKGYGQSNKDFYYASLSDDVAKTCVDA
jgi:hypothetical protein